LLSYTGKPFAEAVQQKLGATVEVAKRNELHTFEVIPQRWVVERSFAWLEKCRDCGKTANENSTPAYKLSISHSSSYCSEDREHALKVGMDGAPFWKIARQHPPLATGLEQVEQSAKDIVQIHGPRLGPLANPSKKGRINSNCSRLTSLAYTFSRIEKVSSQSRGCASN
jgi:hypothetical protein